MAHPHLTRAPIVEALVDLRLDVPLGELSALDAVSAELVKEFPDRKNLARWTGTFNVQSESAQVTSPKPEIMGYGFWSTDKKRVVQARLDGFTFSQLQPYSSWDDLRAASQKHWRAYAAATQPSGVSRCALRYVNRIELPRQMKDLSDYLRTLPTIAPKLPQNLSGLFMRVVLPMPGGAAVITEAVDDAGVTDQVIPLILDIDVFVERKFDPSGEDMWTCLDELRDKKNDIFYESLKPEAWEQYR